jgi:hypothetical protein
MRRWGKSKTEGWGLSEGGSGNAEGGKMRRRAGGRKLNAEGGMRKSEEKRWGGGEWGGAEAGFRFLVSGVRMKAERIEHGACWIGEWEILLRIASFRIRHAVSVTTTDKTQDRWGKLNHLICKILR